MLSISLFGYRPLSLLLLLACYRLHSFLTPTWQIKLDGQDEKFVRRTRNSSTSNESGSVRGTQQKRKRHRQQNSTGQHNNDKPDKPEPNKRRKHHRKTHVPSPPSSTAAILMHDSSEKLNDHSTDSLSTVQARLNTAQRFELLEKQIIVTEAPTTTARARAK